MVLLSKFGRVGREGLLFEFPNLSQKNKTPSFCLIRTNSASQPTDGKKKHATATWVHHLTVAWMNELVKKKSVREAGGRLTPVLFCVEALPGVAPASSGFVVAVALVQASRFLAGRGQATGFAVLKR